MTTQEKQLLQNSARLCGQRNRLLAQIEAEQKKKKPVPIVDRRVENQANKYIEEMDKKKPFSISNALKAAVPSALCLLGTLIPDGFIMLLSVLACIVVFYVVYFKLEKKDNEKEKEKYIKANTAKVEAQRAEALAYNNELQKNITKMQGVLAQIENSLKDPQKCCLHSDYWYAGEEIYHLVENGRADSLKEAINLFENIRQQNRILAQQAQAAEDARWAQLQNMMNEGSSKYDEQKKKHWEEFQRTAIITSLLDDDD